MFTIILAVLLAVAIITIAYLYLNLQMERKISQYYNEMGEAAKAENRTLRTKLSKRIDRHNRASAHIVRQQAELHEHKQALTRTNQIIELFLETFHGLEGEVTVTRNQARRLFVAS